MPLLRGNLHTHTTLSDGVLHPLRVVERYRELGYDFLAITDHRCMIGEGLEAERAYLERLPQGDEGLILLRGIEEEPLEIGRRHMGLIRGVTEELRIVNHPSEYALTVPELIESLRLARADAVEITCHGRHLSAYDTEELGVPRLATDDAHYDREIGVAWIEVDAERDADSILRAIKAGSFRRVIAGKTI